MISDRLRVVFRGDVEVEVDFVGASMMAREEGAWGSR